MGEKIDMLVGMNTEEFDLSLMKFRDGVTGLPDGRSEDQKKMVVWSMMCMVERRKEEQREAQCEKRRKIGSKSRRGDVVTIRERGQGLNLKNIVATVIPDWRD